MQSRRSAFQISKKPSYRNTGAKLKEFRNVRQICYDRERGKSDADFRNPTI